MKLKQMYGIALVLFLTMTLTGCLGILTPDPNFKVLGVIDGQNYEEPVTPVVEAEKGTEITAITLNDEPFSSGTTISEDGDYTLVVVGVNKKDKEKVVEIEFSIEITVPVIGIAGVSEGEYYDTPVTPVISTQDNEDELEIELNGEAYTSGTEISELGLYTLTVTASNAAGKTSTKTVSFEIGIPLVHEFRIFPTLAGLSADKGTLHYVENEVFTGATGSVEIRITSPNTYGSLRIRPVGMNDAHVDWIEDWGQYDTISVKIYLDELDTMPSKNAMDVRVWGSPQARNLIQKDQLHEGWNEFVFDLNDFMGDRANELSNMGTANLLEINANKEGSFYVKDIKLTKNQ